MFTLIMTYCLAGQPCETEAVAHFPQWDVGEYICGVAKPAIEREVRRRAKRTNATLTFKCVPEDEANEPQIPQAHIQPPERTTLYNNADTLIEQGVRLLEQFKR